MLVMGTRRDLHALRRFPPGGVSQCEPEELGAVPLVSKVQ